MSFYGNPQSIDDVPTIQFYGPTLRREVLAMHRVITELDLWNFMSAITPQDYDGYIFSQRIEQILNHPEVDQYHPL